MDPFLTSLKPIVSFLFTSDFGFPILLILSIIPVIIFEQFANTNTLKNNPWVRDVLERLRRIELTFVGFRLQLDETSAVPLILLSGESEYSRNIISGKVPLSAFYPLNSLVYDIYLKMVVGTLFGLLALTSYLYHVLVEESIMALIKFYAFLFGAIVIWAALIKTLRKYYYLVKHIDNPKILVEEGGLKSLKEAFASEEENLDLARGKPKFHQKEIIYTKQRFSDAMKEVAKYFIPASLLIFLLFYYTTPEEYRIDFISNSFIYLIIIIVAFFVLSYLYFYFEREYGLKVDTYSYQKFYKPEKEEEIIYSRFPNLIGCDSPTFQHVIIGDYIPEKDLLKPRVSISEKEKSLIISKIKEVLHLDEFLKDKRLAQFLPFDLSKDLEVVKTVIRCKDKPEVRIYEYYIGNISGTTFVGIFLFSTKNLG